MESLAVVAIDFGTSYSGWAFSYKHDHERDPLHISANNFHGNSLSHKVPTCILIESDGKTTHSFGYDAENTYVELCDVDKQNEWFFFKRFKMMLFKDGGMSRHDTLEDETGKTLPAIKVFSLSIEYLKKNVLDTLNNHVADLIRVSDIHWVLTVPAIWNDAAKQFMREAAQKAKIPEKSLTICLEPEAASVYCRHLPVRKEEASIAKMSSGEKYIILDAGGGTVDITVHEVADNGNLKELYKATGGVWGGTKVDEAFETFLSSIVGSDVMSKFKKHHLYDYIDVFRDFELKKRKISLPGEVEKVTIRMPVKLSSLCQEIRKSDLKDLFEKSIYKDKVIVFQDKIKINAEVFVDFFKPTVSNIVSHVESLFSKSEVCGCSAILMVGGFSESPILQQNVRSAFKHLKVIIPNEANLAVLKGAVIFGHKPTTIIERVCKYTYGYRTTHTCSDSCNHPKGGVKKGDNGELQCHDIFTTYVKAEQSVKVDEEQPEQLCNPLTDDQTAICFGVYASSSRNPQLTTEDGCSFIGKLKVSISDTSSGRNHKFGISFIFGGTEIVVKVVDKESGEMKLKSVDFLG